MVSAAGRILDKVEVVKTAISPDGKLLVLDASSQLSVWLLPDLILIKNGPSGITHIELMQPSIDNDESQSQESAPRIVALTAPAAAGATRELRIYNAADFSIEYELEVNETTELTNVADVENIYILEGKPTAEPSPQYHLRCLSPTLPTNRFYHLLHKQRFDEAMQLAQLFGLDVEMVHRVRVTSLLDAGDKNPEEPGLLDDLKTSLGFLKEAEVIVDSCLQASMPTVQSTLKMLQYGLERIEGDEVSTAEDKALMKTRVYNAIKRLGTYQMANPGGFAAQEWHKFCSVDLCRELISCLSQGRIATAEIIWRRHAYEYDLFSELHSILSSIPEQYPIEKYVDWLAKEVFPNTTPQHHTFAVDWICSRARGLELCQKATWPSNALTLVDACKSILRVHGYGRNTIQKASITTPGGQADQLCASYDGDDLGGDVAAELHGAIGALKTLEFQLKDIAYLAKNMQFAISFNDYVAATPTAVAAQRLEKAVAPELVAGIIEGEVKPYLARHSIQADEFLLTYLRNFMGDMGGMISTLSGSAWEAKALAIIDSVTGRESKLLAILELMRRASVPCSTEVQALVDLALNDPFGQTDEITEQYRIMRLRGMLQTYGIKQFNLTDTSLVRGLLNYLLARQDMETALDDALQLVKAYHHLTEQEAYVGRLENLVENNNLPVFLQTVKRVPQPILAAVGEEFLVWVTDLLYEESTVAGDDRVKDTAIDASLACIDEILAMEYSTAPTVANLRVQRRRLKAIKTLGTEYKLRVGLSTLADESERTQVVLDNLASVFSDSTESTDAAFSARGYHRLSRQLELMSVTRSDLAFALARIYTVGHATALQACLGIRLCDDIYRLSRSKDAAEVLFQVALGLMSHITQQTETNQTDGVNPSTVLQLARQVATSCSPKRLGDALELCQGCELAQALYNQCGIEDTAAAAEPATASTAMRFLDDAHASANGRFTEDGLVLDPAIAGSLAAQFVVATLPFAGTTSRGRPMHSRIAGSTQVRVPGTKSTHMANVSKRAQELVGYLAENNLAQLALRYSVNAIGSCAQHNTVNMDSPEASAVFRALLPRALTVIREVSETLLSKVLTAQVIDRKMAIGYITLLDLQGGFARFRKAISATKKSYARLSELAIIGIGFAQLWSQDGFLQECQQLGKNASWWAELEALGVGFDRKQFEANSAASAEELLPALLQKSSFDFGLAQKFVAEYSVPADAYLATAISLVLTSSKADYQSIVLAMLRQAEDKTIIFEALNDIHRSSVNPYDFERLKFVFNLAIQMNYEGSQGDPWARRGLMLLEILWHYERSAPASEYELELFEAMKSSFEAPDALNPTNSARLPFHVLAYGDALKVVTPELRFHTIGQLCPLAQLLPEELTPDDFIVTLIQREFDSETPPSLKQVHPTIVKIKNQETAVMVAKMMADKCPLGEQKLTALELAVNRATEWLESCEPGTQQHGQVSMVHSKLLSLYNRTLTEFMLVKFGFTEVSLTDVLEDPVQFVWDLYESYLIEASNDAASLENLHHLAEDVCGRLGTSCDAIRRLMIEKWLTHPDGATDSDPDDGAAGAAATLSLASCFNDEDQEEEEAAEDATVAAAAESFGTDTNLHRAIVLLRYTPVDAVVPYLVDFVFLESSTRITPEAQQRAFQALLSIASPAQVSAASNRSPEEINEHLLALHYVRQLGLLHVNQTPSAFISSSKEGVIRSVWRKHRHDQTAVILAANLCVDYCVHDFALWSGILQALLDFRAWGDLSRLLVIVSGIPELWQLPCLSSTWKTVLEGLCSRIEPAGSGVPSVDVRNFVDLALRSPFVLEHDSSVYVKKLSATGHGVAAAACCSIISDTNKRDAAIAKLTKSYPAMDILSQADSVGKTNQDMVNHLLFDFLDKQGQYAGILSSPLFENFAFFLVENDRVTNLVQALQQSDIKKAAHVACLYCSLRGVTALSSQLSDAEIVAGFLEL